MQTFGLDLRSLYSSIFPTPTNDYFHSVFYQILRTFVLKRTVDLTSSDLSYTTDSLNLYLSYNEEDIVVFNLKKAVIYFMSLLHKGIESLTQSQIF